VGVPTDRLIAEWEVEGVPQSGKSLSPDALATLPRLIETGRNLSGRLVPLDVRAGVNASRVLLEIPDSIADLRRNEPDMAEAWRLAVREAFQASFAAGYQAVGMVRDESSAERHCYYELQGPDNPG
jgi:predicted GNAT superfamily acetyltransferase